MQFIKEKWKFILYIFIFCFLTHNVFSYISNTLTTIFFPVNESIWEHTKIIPTSTLILTFIYKIFTNKNNFILSNTIASILSIPILLLIYIPLYLLFKENIIISITVMLLVIIITQYIAYSITKKDKIKYSNSISLILIIVMYIIFGYLSYHPIKNMIFYDPLNELYGVNVYVLKE